MKSIRTKIVEIYYEIKIYNLENNLTKIDIPEIIIT